MGASFVDDMFITENDTGLYEQVMKMLRKKFVINDLGDLRFALGIRFRIDFEKGKVEMDQQNQKERLLELVGLENCKPASTPLPKGMVLERTKEPLSKEDKEELKDFPYRTIVGKIGYLVAGTCPDLAYAFSQLARHGDCARVIHKNAAKHTCRYIKRTVEDKLVYRRTDLRKMACKVSMMADCSYADDAEDFKSHTGALGFMFGCLAWWLSRRQKIVATATFMAETMGSYEAVREMVWQRKLLEEMGLAEVGPSVLWQDNQGVISNTYNGTRHDATKHIQVKYYYKRERLQEGVLILDYLITTRMLADGLSKSIPPIVFLEHKKYYMGWEMMDEMLGVADGKLPQPTKAFKINVPNEEKDTTRSYMVCVSDLFS